MIDVGAERATIVFVLFLSIFEHIHERHSSAFFVVFVYLWRLVFKKNVIAYPSMRVHDTHTTEGKIYCRKEYRVQPVHQYCTANYEYYYNSVI